MSYGSFGDVKFYLGPVPQGQTVATQLSFQGQAMVTQHRNASIWFIIGSRGSQYTANIILYRKMQVFYWCQIFP